MTVIKMPSEDDEEIERIKNYVEEALRSQLRNAKQGDKITLTIKITKNGKIR